MQSRVNATTPGNETRTNSVRRGINRGRVASHVLTRGCGELRNSIWSLRFEPGIIASCPTCTTEFQIRRRGRQVVVTAASYRWGERGLPWRRATHGSGANGWADTARRCCSWARRVPSRADAEDAVQDGFPLRGRAREGRRPRRLPLRLRAVPHWTSSAAAGGRGRREQAVAATEVPPANDALFTCPLERQERREAIEAAMRHLPEPPRGAGPEGVGRLSFPQIGRCSIPPDTAASRYRYASCSCASNWPRS